MAKNVKVTKTPSNKENSRSNSETILGKLQMMCDTTHTKKVSSLPKKQVHLAFSVINSTICSKNLR